MTAFKSTVSASDTDRVRSNTSREINEQLDRNLEERIRFYSTQSRSVISERIAELDREWDIERTLETNAAAIGLTGMVLGLTVSRKWFVLPAIVSGFLLQHAIQGWCPPLPLFRRLGVRTRTEIEQERYALKLLRGDFAGIQATPQGSEPSEIVRTVQC